MQRKRERTTRSKCDLSPKNIFPLNLNNKQKPWYGDALLRQFTTFTRNECVTYSRISLCIVSTFFVFDSSFVFFPSYVCDRMLNVVILISVRCRDRSCCVFLLSSSYSPKMSSLLFANENKLRSNQTRRCVNWVSIENMHYVHKQYTCSFFSSVLWILFSFSA